MNAVRTKGLALLTCGVVLCLAQVQAHADGTEALGDPSIAIASGTHIIGAGTGTFAGPGVINLNIPAGVTIQQVLLYWEGFADSAVTGDNEITVDGNNVLGQLIGGPTFFFSPAWAFTYRADITGLGVVSPGANAINIGGFNFATANNGAGILVIYDDGTPPAQIGLRDGSDLAFVNFAPPLNATVPQTFNFVPANFDRQADVVMFVGSVDVNVSSIIRITSGGIVTDIVDLLGNTDGPQWDTISSTVPIPANTSSITFEIISGPGPVPFPASLDWLTASFAILPAPINGTIIIKALTIPPGGTGFTFSDDIRAPNGFVLDDTQMEMFLEVPPGDYSVDEDDPTINPGGWSLIDLVC
ncbi:MAG TPA: hypothetical protein P5572_14710, partial [Phycisphaerae bacterium]|nr:hypothetical protein [Phycisphaerae bacterium]